MSAAGFAIAFIMMLTGCSTSRGGGCALPGTLPQIAGTPIPTQPIPAEANASGTFTVIVYAVVDASGNVSSERIATSSGNAVIDSAALTIVGHSQFRQGFAGCGESAPPNTAVVSVTFAS